MNKFYLLYFLAMPLIFRAMKCLVICIPKKVVRWLFALSLACPIAYAGDIEDASRLFKESHYSHALDKVNGLLAGKPQDAQGRFLKGLILAEQGKTTDAINIFFALTEDFPELPEPFNNIAVLYASQGQYEKAKLALEMAIRTHPSYATAHDNLGDIYAKMASQAYDRALQLDRSNTESQTKLEMIQVLIRDGNREKEKSASIPSNLALDETEAAVIAVKTENSPVALQPVPPTMTAINPEPVAPPPLPDPNKEVIDIVNAWAAAWSSQDVNKYLSFYAADFKTPNDQSRADWEATRKERVKNPKYIQVIISKATLKFIDAEHVAVSFRQSYRASHHNASSKKTLLMVKSDGNWLIQEERTR